MRAEHISSALYTATTILFGVGLRLVEIAIVAPERLDKHPFEAFAIQFELLIASGGILLGAHLSARSELAGRINIPLFGLLIAFLWVYILLLLSARTWEWISPFEVVLAVWLPDLTGVVMLSWSVWVAREMAREMAHRA